jgi:hypothetical protein
MLPRFALLRMTCISVMVMILGPLICQNCFLKGFTSLTEYYQPGGGVSQSRCCCTLFRLWFFQELSVLHDLLCSNCFAA